MMRHRGFPITGAIVLAGAAVLGLAAPGDGTRLPAFEPGVGTHETRTELQTGFELPTVSEVPTPAEVEIPAPTRSSFTAAWSNVSGAMGYLLDVSTSQSFTNYVDGYHDLDVGNVTRRVVTGLNPGTAYYYRVRPYDASGPGSYSEVMIVTTVATTGLMIHATFDSSITNHPNAVAIQAMINRSISIYESLFDDPITIQIRFRYATTNPDGTPLPAGSVARSLFVVYSIPWGAYINALRTDATTSSDNVANASLPASSLSPNIRPSSAGGRAVGFNTPPAMFANGTVGNGGPYDGIVTLNSSYPFQFTRPPSNNNFDAQRLTEHEIDEVIGLGSRLNTPRNDVRPQDLFSWSSPGIRNITTSGTRYFSINGGVTNLVNFNQNPQGDLGDWLSTSCPQAHPYVQNAFVCPGQFSDVTTTSPEGINLDVIGYDLLGAPTPTPTPARAAVADFNSDGSPDYVLRNTSNRRTVIWYLDNNVYIGYASAPTLPASWTLAALADFNRDSHPDYGLFNPVTEQTVIWYLNNNIYAGYASGPTLPSGWELVAAADFNNNSNPDYVLYKATTRQTVVWYLNNNVYVSYGVGPTLPAGWNLVGVADFNRDGHVDYALFNSNTSQTIIGYLSGLTVIGAAYGPTIPGGWQLVATADFNADGNPDYVLYKATTRQTSIWYLNNNIYVGYGLGPTLPAGWSLVAP
jgi:hypothetical protein